MPSSSAPSTTDDWKKRIAPHLSTSLQTASDRITRSAPVQRWLQEASMEAAEGLGQMSGVQGEMMGYMRMMENLEAALPALVEAVDELTEGCGQLELNWRPLNPNFSRLYIDFDRDFTVKVFCRLSDCTREAVRDVMATIAEALPAGEPFPNRPNTVTGFVARDGRGIGVRIKDHQGPERGRHRTVTLLPESQEPIESLAPAKAVQALHQLLCSSGSSADAAASSDAT